jgi:glycosyltransferase involved in cell wall biosynthesis
MKKLFIVVNVDYFLLSHRLPIALAALRQGYEVTIITKNTGKRKEIESHGLRFINLPFERSGRNPLHEIGCIRHLFKLYRKHKPDIIHHVTLKASLLGCIAAKLAKRKNVVSAISGFGYNFTNKRNGTTQKIIRTLMKLAFRSEHFHYIFQNPDDIDQFKRLRFTPDVNIHLIKGSGVDLTQFSFEPDVIKEKVSFLLPARMLIDKGIIEFMNAAKKIKDRNFLKAEFILAGACDTINLAGIPEDALETMTDLPYIRWIGYQEDMFQVIKYADVIVLPSYREGLPKSLIEACAVGRPIITTDTQGCRECVINGYNGYLIPVKDTDLLAQRMEKLINDKEMRSIMGSNSRKLAEKEFSIENVIAKHFEIYGILINREPGFVCE